MAGKLETTRIEDASRWDAFVSESPQGSVFSSSAWLDAAATAQGGAPVRLGVLADGFLIGGAGFVEVRKGPLRKATTPVLTPSGGFLYAPFTGTKPTEGESRNAAAAGAMIEYLTPRYGYIFLSHDPRAADVREFLWRGFSSTVRYTYVLDIREPDRVWDRMERRVRTVVRNAESSLSLDGPISVGEFGKLYERTYRDRDNTPPLPRSQVEAFTQGILVAGLGEMRTVRDASGEPVAAMVFAFDRRSAYALVSGTIPSRNPSGASSLLFWDAVRRYGGGRERLDLVGANLRNIAFFKKGFGGTLTPYFVTERYGSSTTRALFSLYTRLRKAFL